MLKKASRTAFALSSMLDNTVSATTINKLFNQLIEPILLYRVEQWLPYIQTQEKWLKWGCPRPSLPLTPSYPLSRSGRTWHTHIAPCIPRPQYWGLELTRYLAYLLESPNPESRPPPKGNGIQIQILLVVQCLAARCRLRHHRSHNLRKEYQEP